MTIRYLRYVPYELIDDYLRKGWMVLIPNAPSPHNIYGIVMGYLCECGMR